MKEHTLPRAKSSPRVSAARLKPRAAVAMPVEADDEVNEASPGASQDLTLPQRILPQPWPFLMSVVTLGGKQVLVTNTTANDVVAKVAAKKTPVKRARVARAATPSGDAAPF